MKYFPIGDRNFEAKNILDGRNDVDLMRDTIKVIKENILGRTFFEWFSFQYENDNVMMLYFLMKSIILPGKQDTFGANF